MVSAQVNNKIIYFSADMKIYYRTGQRRHPRLGHPTAGPRPKLSLDVGRGGLGGEGRVVAAAEDLETGSKDSARRARKMSPRAAR